ncbi:fatty acid hydroxylase family protein [archaeon]|nr:MAG: fatty acid hydroxylase family protein [archaeon]
MEFLKPLGTFFYIVPIKFPIKHVDDVPDYISQAVPYFFLLILLEILIGKWKKYPLYTLRDTIMSMSLGTVQQLLGLFTKELSYIPYTIVYEHFAPLRAKFYPTITTNSSLDAAFFLLAFLGNDLGYYVFHRVSHEWHFLWGAHSVHHSGERYNLATALRQGATQNLFSWVVYLPLAAIGLPPAHHVRHSRLNTLYQFWIHTEVIHRLPPLIELIFNTASHHRMHHRPPGNCNYAGVLIVWDRLFGTFEPEDHTLITPAPVLSKTSAESPSAAQLGAELVQGKIGYHRGLIYGLAQPLNSLDPVYANLCHFARQYKLTMDTLSRGDFGLYKFLCKILSKRVDHKLEIVTDVKRLAPDVVFDYEYYQVLRTAQGKGGVTVDQANQLLHIVQLPPPLPDVTSPSSAHTLSHAHLTPRELAFIKGRQEREGRQLSATGIFCVVIHFAVTLLAAYSLMLFHSHPSFPLTWFGKVMVALGCVLSLQMIKYY